MVGIAVVSVGEPKLGTRQMPVRRIFCQSSPSWIWPRTPIFSIIRPFSIGREGSTSGRGREFGAIGWIPASAGMTVVGVGVGRFPDGFPIKSGMTGVGG